MMLFVVDWLPDPSPDRSGLAPPAPPGALAPALL
jgi:hypothetical protein